jgi:hypothetical protein
MRILEQFFEDVRFALRSLRKRPSFTVVAILSLAVALGANTAVFSFARAIVLDKLPAPGADRFVIARQRSAPSGCISQPESSKSGTRHLHWSWNCLPWERPAGDSPPGSVDGGVATGS